MQQCTRRTDVRRPIVVAAAEHVRAPNYLHTLRTKKAHA